MDSDSFGPPSRLVVRLTHAHPLPHLVPPPHSSTAAGRRRAGSTPTPSRPCPRGPGRRQPPPPPATRCTAAASAASCWLPLSTWCQWRRQWVRGRCGKGVTVRVRRGETVWEGVRWIAGKPYEAAIGAWEGGRVCVKRGEAV